MYKRFYTEIMFRGRIEKVIEIAVPIRTDNKETLDNIRKAKEYAEKEHYTGSAIIREIIKYLTEKCGYEVKTMDFDIVMTIGSDKPLELADYLKE